ncbi:MAG: membrane fusion protein Use1-domain-containing protein [Olpidium bornovanus]|uniref:Membrane fusion protein Use1-domain-containing protein n=1 Tax=Olpidium bornovanus TaxID=278681 RepID=A0A8H7ZVC5_9FUNG|nr:MAG: membrane fusion protein Use1-domain-containing protein [Olpidium bornovanus]
MPFANAFGQVVSTNTEGEKSGERKGVDNDQEGGRSTKVRVVAGGSPLCRARKRSLLPRGRELVLQCWPSGLIPWLSTCDGRQESRANSESTGLRDSIMTWSLEEKKNELFRIDRAVSSSLNMISEEGLRERSMNNGANGDEPGAENQQLLLDHHQHLQEKLSQDLLGMAAVLKQNSLVFGQVLKRDEQTITNAQSLLEGNLNRLRSTRGRLQVYSQKAGKTTLFVWAVVLFVCSASVLVYLFIRIFPKLRSF